MKRLVSKLILLVSAILLISILPASAQPDIQAVKHNIQQRLDEGNMLGISIAYINPGGHVKYFSGGFLSTDGNQSVNRNTIFEIGSVTETFTTLIFVQMAFEHELSVNDPIRKFLPASVRVPSYKGQEITLLHLATQTSGLPQMPPDFSPGDTLNPYADFKAADLYHFLNQFKLAKAPGSSYQHSNPGIGLLGHLLARAVDTSYEQLLRNYVIAPLGMFDTGMTVSKNETGQLAEPYDHGHPVKRWDWGDLEGAGGIQSTTADMATYMKAQMGLLKTGLGDITYLTHQVRYHTGHDGAHAIGLAWMESTKNDTIIYKSGRTGGFSSFIGFNKQEDRGVVVLASGKDQVNDIGFHMLDKRYPLKKVQNSKKNENSKKIASPKENPPEKKRSEVNLGVKVLNRYIGTYLTTSGIKYFVFRRGQQLRVQVAGKSSRKVFAESKHRFFFKSIPAEVKFSDDKGASHYFTLYQNGEKITANRVYKHKDNSRTKKVNGYTSTYKRYEGVFKISVGDYITITKKGNQLLAQPTGQQKITAHPISRYKFLLKPIDAKIEFVKGENGAFDKMRIYKSGQVIVATRLND